MLKEGDSIKSIRGTGPPLMAHELGIVAAARGSGLKPLPEDKPLLDTISGDGANAKREFIWTFDGDCYVDFVPIAASERIELNEFVRRFNDLEWIKANLDHPIAYMRAMWNQLVVLRDCLRGMKPLLRLERESEDDEMAHHFTVLIPQDCTPEERAEFMRMYEEGR